MTIFPIGHGFGINTNILETNLINLAAVKGVGVGAVEEILRARKEGKFISVEDFAKRVAVGRFNKKAWESLIKSGGFDSLADRSDLLFNLETIQAFASKLQK